VSVIDFKILTVVNGDEFVRQAGLVTTSDVRLTDARTPLPHTHQIADVVGLADRLSAIELRVTNLEAATHPQVVNASLNTYRQVGTNPVERWYLAGCVNSTDLGSGFATSTALYAVPQVFPTQVTIDKLSLVVTAVNSGVNARMGIYESVGSFTNTTPGVMVLDAGEVSIGTTGVKTLAISQTLQPNKLYYFCLIADSPGVPPNVRQLLRAGVFPLLGISTSFTQSQSQCWQGTMAYGPLPTNFPSPVVLTIDPPALAFHYSA
jgi:hypothetical protein